jgi:uncharacterized protein YbjT (DUF2867 family)
MSIVVVSEGTKNIVAAMEKHGVQRLVCASALGVAESKQETSLLGKFGALTFMKTMFADKARQETIIKRSRLDWVIVRPSILTNKPATGRYRAARRLKLGIVATIPRADVANFMLKQLTDNTFVHKTVAVSL